MTQYVCGCIFFTRIQTLTVQIKVPNSRNNIAFAEVCNKFLSTWTRIKHPLPLVDQHGFSGTPPPFVVHMVYGCHLDVDNFPKKEA